MTLMEVMNTVDEVDWNLWPVLGLLLETGSVTETARRLGRTQSAVSHSLNALRRALNDELFVRVGGKFEATPRARSLEPRVREVRERVGALLAPQAFEPRTLERTFRLLLSDYVQLVVLPRLMEALRDEAPGVRLDVHFRSDAMAANLSDVASAKYDVSVAPTVDAPAGVVRQKLFDDENVCVLRARNRALQRWTVKAFAELPHLQISARGLGPDFVDQALAKHGLKRHVALRVPHYGTAPAMVLHDESVAVVPRRVAQSWSDVRGLAVVEAPLPLPGFTMAQYFPELLRRDPVHQWFRRLVQRAVE
jgi:DNA-binding transcriptional LysR family regulator